MCFFNNKFTRKIIGKKLYLEFLYKLLGCIFKRMSV